MKEAYVAPTVTPMGSFQEETGIFLDFDWEGVLLIGDYEP